MAGDNCELCLVGGGEYQFSRLCCRVRFLAQIPRHQRSIWLDYWRRKDPRGSTLVDEVETEFRKRWAETKVRNRANYESLRAGLTKTG